MIPHDWIEDVHTSEQSIETIFGSILYVVGLDKPQRIEGLTFDGGVIDENSNIKPGTFDRSILPMLVLRNGWCWFTGVPDRFGIGAAEYRTRFEAAVAGELPDSAGFSWPSSDIIAPEKLEYARKTMDERDFEERFNASWLSTSGGVFHSFNREYNVRRCTYDPSKPILVGSDFNVNPMAWVLCHLTGDTLEVFDEIWLRNTNTPEALNIFVAKYKDNKCTAQMYGDASARGRRTSAYLTDYNHIKSDTRFPHTMHYLRGNPSVPDRFSVTNARLCDGEGTMHVFIDPCCSHLIADLEIRSYKPGTREAADYGDVGHPSDALGYLIFRKWAKLVLGLRIPSGGKIFISKGVA